MTAETGHPALYNDRLLLGLEGTMSEAALHILKSRMHAGRQAKAQRVITSKLHGVDHPAAARAATLLRQGRRRQAQAMLETTLTQLAGTSNGNGLAWFSRAGL